MGVPAKSPLTTRAARLLRDRSGLALPTALFALVVVSLLCLGLFQMTDLEAKSSRNREHAARAMHLAEAGGAHALAVLRANLRDTSMTRLLRGWDGSGGTSDDGYINGYPGLDSATRVPPTGKAAVGGTYYVQLIDDPADTDGNPLTDSNGRIVARCKGQTTDGAVAEVDAIIAIVSLPAVAIDGSLKINGNPELVGQCGGAHANDIVVVSGTPTVSGRISASDTVEISGEIQDTTGAVVQPLHHQPPMEIPDLNPMDYCGEADYLLQANGWVVRLADGATFNANGSAQFGWKKASNSPVVWDQTGSAVEGTFCAEGNVKVANNIGSAANPFDMSIIATGSIEMSGNPYINASHSEGISMMAGGDISFSGNPDVISENYSGLIYAGSQCKISGSPKITGQVVCKDDPNPPGSNEYASENAVSGNPEIRYDCRGNLLAKRRVLFWYPRVGA